MAELKILAFDSTAKVASVAVSDGERILGCYNIDNGLTQSELLLPMAEDLLKSLKLSFSDIEMLACSVGPGSFTGVRIGVSLVKGIAFGKGLPCAEISTLEALAENLSGLSGIIVPCMDARRGQFYTAVFDGDGNKLVRITDDAALSAKELAQKLCEFDSKDIYIVGDGYAVAHKLLGELGIKLSQTPEILRNQNAASIAKIASRLYEDGKTISDPEIAPTYLRVPQAERERLERLKSDSL